MILRLVIFLSIVPVFTASTLAQADRSPFPTEKVLSSADHGLKGKVRRLVVYARSSPDRIEETFSFDRFGRAVERTDVRGNGVNRVLYNYDGNGRVIGYEGYLNELRIYSIVIKLNPDGTASEVTTTDHRKKPEHSGNWSATYEYKRDASGRVVERLSSLKDRIGGSGGFVISFGLPPGLYREVFRYDERGNNVAYELYLPKPYDDIPFVRSFLKYDSHGRKVEESVPTSSDRAQVDAYRYNDMGDIVEMKQYEPITEATKRQVGDRLKIIDSRGTVQNGLLTSDRPNTVLWDLIECSYAYDRSGNWTTKSCVHTVRDGKVPDTTGDQRRAIEYFPN